MIEEEPGSPRLKRLATDLLQLAVIAPLADSYAPNVPIPIMNLIVNVLGRIGRLLGYKESYARYSA